MMAKSLMCVWKKLHRPTKEQIILTSVGSLVCLMTLSLFFPGLIPSCVRMHLQKQGSFLPWNESKVRHFLVSEDAFVQIDLEVILLQSGQNLF